MSNVLLSPPVAFVVYLVLVGIMVALGRTMAGPAQAIGLKASAYSSGEAPPEMPAAPGYRPFFVVALFFAILHLGGLVMASGAPSVTLALYLGGLVMALLALILG